MQEADPSYWDFYDQHSYCTQKPKTIRKGVILLKSGGQD